MTKHQRKILVAPSILIVRCKVNENPATETD